MAPLALARRSVRDVVDALSRPLIVRHFIRCRLRDENFSRTSAAAFARTGPFPNIIGAVEGSCMRIQKPAHSGWQYYCRKGFTALNVLAAVDAHGRFVYINANFPGSVHDASVYSASQVRYAFEEGAVPHGYSFIGDSGFANGNDVITPIRNPATRQEVSYNRWHSKMRVIVECTFGTWKRKFAIVKDRIRVNHHCMRSSL
ncbi:unnamed protein product [Cylicostephanus goldi]|uniref:DDE Tnp4 domain-containing protein n=1 Tax=Cylicostephanus goldi TaxID=71465 RepID=A0A3P7NJM5_CYLGO|nr:unnamed protein product [Cylicostephanus goldi]